MKTLQLHNPRTIGLSQLAARWLARRMFTDIIRHIEHFARSFTGGNFQPWTLALTCPSTENGIYYGAQL